jgi:hypothetical protein
LKTADAKSTVQDMGKAVEVIDDLSSGSPAAATGSGWVLISDRVMGGVSSGSVRHDTVAGRPAIRMRGGVSLQNKGGFLQIALDLGDAGGPVDASAWTGIQFDVIGNSQTYNLHLRTTDRRAGSHRPASRARNRA